MTYKVLISDNLSKDIIYKFNEADIDVVYSPEMGKNSSLILNEIHNFDAIAIRSDTKINSVLLNKATKLKVIGRAGIGIDNIDLKLASNKGIVVMNTPFGNATTTAEHTMAMIFSSARKIPAANESTHSGKWEKNNFIGTELSGKKLGVVGIGNIGSIVVSLAQSIGMEIIAYDPFLSNERAKNLKISKTTCLSELLSQSDIVTLHLPINENTNNIISSENIFKMKKGSILINCARGGLVDENAVVDAIQKNHLSAAAFDVYLEEPALSNPLFGLKNVICTPHLGASTTEAQEKVSFQIAEQIIDFLNNGAITNALNAPPIDSKEAPLLNPWIKLAKNLGSFVGQITDAPILDIEIEYVGKVGELNFKPISSALIAEILKPLVGIGLVNMVSAPLIARNKGIKISEIRRDTQGAFDSYIRVVLNHENILFSIAGTIYSDGKPRFIQINSINLEAEPVDHMLYTTNIDKPGYIGALGMVLGEANVNIATFSLGRDKKNGKALALLGVDEAISDKVIEKIKKLPQVEKAKSLNFF